MVQKPPTNSPQSPKKQTPPIAEKDIGFLEKVMHRSNLDDVYDARDITELVYRTMRDLMTTEASDRVAEELHEDALPNARDKSLHIEVADLWRDTNPLVSFLSRVRPPFHGPVPFTIDDNLFTFRIEQEGGLPSGLQPETVIRAVFSATKDELSSERIQEVASFLPGRIRQMWEEA